MNMKYYGMDELYSLRGAVTCQPAKKSQTHSFIKGILACLQSLF